MASELKLRFGWPFPVMKDGPPATFITRSAVIVPIVGTFSKIWLSCMNTVTIYNGATFSWWVNNRPADQPLITVSNHYSCMDDPLIFGALPWRTLWSAHRMRWSLAAHDIVFTSRFNSWFFSTGKCVPVIRGIGVEQRAVDFCAARLREGAWVHIFPEGKVNEDHSHMRLKWGVGRLVYECWAGRCTGEDSSSGSNNSLAKSLVGALFTPRQGNKESGVAVLAAGVTSERPAAASCSGDCANPGLPPPAPVVLPIYHLGMDSVLPNGKLYVPRVGKRITIVVGEPIHTDALLARLQHARADAATARKVITDHIQSELAKLRKVAEGLHGGSGGV